jgi:hypothetical protein
MIMPEAYRAIEHLRDGRPIEIRALRPDDEKDILAAIGRASTEALRRRFFVAKRGLSQKEIDFFMRIDFRNHVALIAQADEDGRPTSSAAGATSLLNLAVPRWLSWSWTAIRGKASGRI